MSSNKIKQLHDQLKYTIDRINDKHQASQQYETLDELKANGQKLDAIVQQLTRLQAPVDNESDKLLQKVSVQDRHARLSEWLQQHAPDCGIGKYWRIDSSGQQAGGCGLVATADIPTDTLMIAVPRNIMLTSDSILQGNAPQDSTRVVSKLIAGDQLCTSMPSMAVVLQVWYDRYVADDSSYYAPYIQSLPAELYLPMMCSYSELSKNLQASGVLADTLQLQRLTVKHYLHVQTLIKQHNSKLQSSQHLSYPTYRQFRWAVATVMARQNKILSALASDLPEDADIDVNDSRYTSIALMPGFDLCNHTGKDKISSTYNPVTRTGETYATHNVAADQPLLLYYGDRPNSKLFMFMGFVDLDHLSDELDFVLKLPVSEDAALQKIRMLMIRKAQLEVNQAFKLPLPVEPREWQQRYQSNDLQLPVDADPQEHQQNNTDRWHGMLHWLRCAVLEKAEAPDALKQQAMDKTNILKHPVSRGNEPAALQLLKSLIQLDLIPYETSLEHDEELLADTASKMSEHERRAVQLRVSEKRILHQAIQQVSKWQQTMPTFQIDAL